jgi:hypothetical protein
MHSYWESSVKGHLEREKKKHQERLNNKTNHPKIEVKTMEKKVNKYDIGDIVIVNGYDGKYKVVEWFYEMSYSAEEGKIENTYYNLDEVGGKKRFLDVMYEHELAPSNAPIIIEDKQSFALKDRNSLTSDDINNLLDEYNKFIELHSFITSNGIVDNYYKERAEGILKFLSK